MRPFNVAAAGRPRRAKPVAGAVQTRRRFLLLFAGRTALVLTLLLLSWPGLGHAFCAVVAAISNPLASVVFSKPAGLHLSPEGPADSWNALLTLTQADGKMQQLLWELRRTPYLPMAVFVALTLGFPLGAVRRRVAVLGIGLAALQVLPLMRLMVLLGSDSPAQMFAIPAPLQAMLMVAVRALVLPPGMAYAVPGLLWMLLITLLDRNALNRAVTILVPRHG